MIIDLLHHFTAGYRQSGRQTQYSDSYQTQDFNRGGGCTRKTQSGGGQGDTQDYGYGGGAYGRGDQCTFLFLTDTLAEKCFPPIGLMHHRLSTPLLILALVKTLLVSVRRVLFVVRLSMLLLFEG
jgi:hypothetical protein